MIQQNPSTLSTEKRSTKINTLGEYIKLQYFCEGAMESSYHWSFKYMTSVPTVVMDLSNLVAVASRVSFLVILCRVPSPCLVYFQSGKIM